MGSSPFRVRVAAASDEEAMAALGPLLGPHSWFVVTDEVPELGAWVDIEAIADSDERALLTGRGRVGWRYLADTAPPGRQAGFGAWVRWGSGLDDHWRPVVGGAPAPPYAPPGSRLSLRAPPVVRPPVTAGSPPPVDDDDKASTLPGAPATAEVASDRENELPGLDDDDGDDEDTQAVEEEATAEVSAAFEGTFGHMPTVSTADERAPSAAHQPAIDEDDAPAPTEDSAPAPTGDREPIDDAGGARALPDPLVAPDPMPRPTDGLQGRSWLVRPTPEGSEIRQLHTFGWPASGTMREPTPFEEYEEPEPPHPEALPLPPELTIDETADAFNDEVTDPDRLSAFVHAAVDDAADVDQVVTDPEGPVALGASDATLETQEDFEPLKVNDDDSSEAPPTAIEAVSAGAPPPPAATDEGDDDSSDAGFSEETEDDLPPDGMRKGDAPNAPRASQSLADSVEDEEDPAVEHEQPAGDRPRLEDAVWVALPGEPPQELFESGAPLPAAKRREVGGGGDRFVEVGAYVQRGGQRELLGIARFETAEEGAVFPIELTVEPGWLTIGADIDDSEAQRFRLTAERGSRPQRHAPGPGAQTSGLIGRLKRFLGN